MYYTKFFLKHASDRGIARINSYLFTDCPNRQHGAK